MSDPRLVSLHGAAGAPGDSAATDGRPIARSQPSRVAPLIARIRSDGDWSHARVHAVTSHEVTLGADLGLARGDVVEIWLGQTCVIAEVEWVADGRFGVRSRDPVRLDGPGAAGNRQGAASEIARAKAPDAHEASRSIAQRLQFLALVAFAASGGGAVYIVAGRLLHAVAGPVSAALG